MGSRLQVGTTGARQLYQGPDILSFASFCHLDNFMLYTLSRSILQLLLHPGPALEKTTLHPRSRTFRQEPGLQNLKLPRANFKLLRPQSFPYSFETHAALVRHVRRCVIMTKRHGGLVELPMSIEAESSPIRRLVDLRQYSYKV